MLNFKCKTFCFILHGNSFITEYRHTRKTFSKLKECRYSTFDYFSDVFSLVDNMRFDFFRNGFACNTHGKKAFNTGCQRNEHTENKNQLVL